MKKLLALISVALLSSCSFQREPGPAERIGRALDEMRKGIDELAPEETTEERRAREDREWQRRQDDYYLRKGLSREEQERLDREFWDQPSELERSQDSRDADRY